MSNRLFSFGIILLLTFGSFIGKMSLITEDGRGDSISNIHIKPVRGNIFDTMQK